MRSEQYQDACVCLYKRMKCLCRRVCVSYTHVSVYLCIIYLPIYTLSVCLYDSNDVLFLLSEVALESVFLKK